MGHGRNAENCMATGIDAGAETKSHRSNENGAPYVDSRVSRILILKHIGTE